MSLVLSCENDFLEKTPGVDVTEDTIFSTAEQLDYYMAGTYFWGVMSDLPYCDIRGPIECSSDCATDIAETEASWYWVHKCWTNGVMNPSDSHSCGDLKWETYWKAIRRCNIILERIDDPVLTPFDDPDFKKRCKGEAHMILALNYFELFTKYGGVPIIRKRLNSDDDLLIPRSTLEETVNFVLEHCEEAIKLLPKPNELTDAERGRLTNVAAMCLKSRTLLYAASPLYNTDKPYLDFGANNDLIVYGNYDKERWKLAADAADEAIKEALATGHDLVRNKTMVEDGKEIDITYRYIWETPDNEEVILADQSKSARYIVHFPWGPSAPETLEGMSGSMMPLNFMKKYEKKDGTPQKWDMEGGNDLLKKYSELEPRFQQTVAYQGTPWNRTFPSIDCSQTGRQVNKVGQFIHKPVPYIVSNVYGENQVPKGIMFRLAELYLNYAEALNEYNETPPAEAYDAVDLIRERVGLPGWKRTLSKEEFRAKLHDEKGIEFCHEGLRLYDLLRWMECENEGVMNGAMYGIKIEKLANGDCSYAPYIYGYRTFNRRMYKLPFLQSEVNKGYLIQNPGY